MLTVDPYTNPMYSCYTPFCSWKYGFIYFFMSYSNLYQCIFILSLLPHMLQDWMKYLLYTHTFVIVLILYSRYRRFVTLYYYYSFWLVASMFLPLFTFIFNMLVFELGSFNAKISFPLLVFMWLANLLSIGIMVFELIALLKDSVTLEQIPYQHI